MPSQLDTRSPGCGGRQFQIQLKAGGRALRPNRATVRFDDAPHDREAQTCASRRGVIAVSARGVRAAAVSVSALQLLVGGSARHAVPDHACALCSRRGIRVVGVTSKPAHHTGGRQPASQIAATDRSPRAARGLIIAAPVTVLCPLSPTPRGEPDLAWRADGRRASRRPWRTTPPPSSTR